MPEVALQVDEQEHSQWCWAAVTVSVERYYAPSTGLRQCGVAHLELGLRCCDRPERACNQAHRLDPPLDRVGRLRGRPIAKVLTFDEIRHEIDAERPICIRIAWRDGGGHFIVIVGYEVTPRGVNKVIVEDPARGRGRALVPYNQLLSNYDVGHGEWTATFFLAVRAAGVRAVGR